MAYRMLVYSQRKMYGGIMNTEQYSGKKFNNNEHDYSFEQKYIFAGPLNLNFMTKKASTAMGSEILLGENDFEALYLLATNEGEYRTFQQLYEVAWGKSETTDSLDFASAALENLVLQINNVGDDFMWIEFTQGEGYTFKTRWGHNWNSQGSKSSYIPRKTKAYTVTPIIKIDNASQETQAAPETAQTPDKKQKSRKSPIISILAGVGALAATIALVLVLLYSTGIMTPQEAEPAHIEIEDPNTPLASPDSAR